MRKQEKRNTLLSNLLNLQIGTAHIEKKRRWFALWDSEPKVQFSRWVRNKNHLLYDKKYRTVTENDKYYFLRVK